MKLSDRSDEKLQARRKVLVLKRKELILKLKNAKRPLIKKALLAQLRELNFRLQRISAEINKRRASVVRQGLKASPVKPLPIKPAFVPSNASSFVPAPQPQVSVIKPALPKPVPMPSFTTHKPLVKPPAPQATVPVMPAMVDEIVAEEQVISDAELDTHSEGFDFMDFIMKNKLMFGAGALIALYFAFGRKKKPRSNPRKKKCNCRKKNGKCTCRKNPRRSVRSNRSKRGYKRR